MRREELTEQELDALLALAHAGVVQYVREKTDLSAGLVALMPGGEANSAEIVLRMRSAAYELDRGYELSGPDRTGALVSTLVSEAGKDSSGRCGHILSAATVSALGGMFLFLLDLLDVIEQAEQDLTDDLARTLDHVFVVARILARDLTDRRFCSRLLPLRLERAHDMVLDLDPDLYREVGALLSTTRLIAQRHGIDTSDLTLGLRRRLSTLKPSDFGIARTIARSQSLHRTLAQALARALTARLEHIPVDASGVDLSWLRMPDTALLTGTVWNGRTSWPEEIRAEVEARSEEISPGVYLVRSGTERDRSYSERA